MLLTDRKPIEIWQKILPEKHIIAHSDHGFQENLIFHYRRYLYFIHDDGAVVRMNKPSHLSQLSIDDLWELLFYDRDTFDYDDHGIFSIGAILLHMGYLVEMNTRQKENYIIEWENVTKVDEIHTLKLTQVSFPYALYHAYIYCHQLNKKSDEEKKYEVIRIAPIQHPIEQVPT